MEKPSTFSFSLFIQISVFLSKGCFCSFFFYYYCFIAMLNFNKIIKKKKGVFFFFLLESFSSVCVLFKNTKVLLSY